MNNEQNNNGIFGIPNQNNVPNTNPIEPNNNIGEIPTTIPGANSTPIDNSTVSQETTNETITNNPTQPEILQATPSIITAETPNNVAINSNQKLNTSPTNNEPNPGQDSVVSVGKYLIHLILCCIPIVNIIILFVRAFGKKENKNLSNLSKAQLILVAIGTVISIILTIIIMSLAVNIANENQNNINNSYYNQSYNSYY